MIQPINNLYMRTTDAIARVADAWLMGLLARLIFAAVLFFYFFNSAMTKFDGGPLAIADAAYFQIVPPIVEAAGYDTAQVAFFPWGLIVHAGTYAEVILPIFILLGLLTRLAAVGMIGFTVVQSYVDIAFHGVDDATIGAWFDNLSNAVILDQRALWVFLFAYLAFKGAGKLSLDFLIARGLRGQ
ncbi:MAG: DoxX family protein [Pseudomonadota bacterium]